MLSVMAPHLHSVDVQTDLLLIPILSGSVDMQFLQLHLQ